MTTSRSPIVLPMPPPATCAVNSSISRLHAQRVGADAGVRFAQVMSEFANRIGSYRAGSAPGLDAVRQYGANMTMLTSGLLAGFADALRQQSENKKAM